MSVGLVLVTHDGIGRVLLAEAERLLGRFTAQVRVLGVETGDDPGSAQQSVAAALQEVDAGDGALLLTDIFGATPSNIAHRCVGSRDRQVVHGLNLAMLMRAHNYAHLPLGELVEKIVDGGRQSIFPGEPD
ncbi:MAG: PTS fructose transporter subunit IIA [Pseudomonadota bacterium]